MHKIVNGKRIELTTEEEKEFLESQRKGSIKKKKRLEEKKLKDQKKQDAMDKIKTLLNLTEEEIELIFN